MFAVIHTTAHLDMNLDKTGFAYLKLSSFRKKLNISLYPMLNLTITYYLLRAYSITSANYPMSFVNM